jgi:hypothetical protein
MAVFGLSFGFILLAVLAMAVGVLAGRPAIKGSCGGLNGAVDGLPACGACAQPCPARKRALRRGAHNMTSEVQQP